MATYTEKLNLKLPDYTDPADVQDLNENFQKIDDYASQTGGKVSSVTVNGTKHEPDEDGNVDLGTIRGGDGGAQYINELLPDPNEESVEEDNVVLPVKADDSDKLGGKNASEYLTADKVVNNLATTESGYVADARMLKYLEDRKLNLANAFFANKSTYSDIAVSDFDTFIDGVTTYGNMMQTAINKAAVQHGDYYFGNLQYVLYSINYEKNYGWLLSISFSGIYWGYRRNASTFTWVKIA